MQNNPEIEQLIEQSVRIARDRKHEYVLTEHLLMALLQHAPFRACLIKFGTEINHFDRDLSKYLDSLTQLIKDDPDTGKALWEQYCPWSETNGGYIKWRLGVPILPKSP